MSKKKNQQSKNGLADLGTLLGKPESSKAVTQIMNHQPPEREITSPLGDNTDVVDCGATVFDAIEDLGSIGQITAHRAIANSAICQAVFAANAYLDSELEDKAAYERMQRNCTLYSYTKHQVRVLSDASFDQPMDLTQAIEFASTTASARQLEALDDEVLKVLGVTKERLKLIDAKAQQRAGEDAAKLRDAIKANAQGIEAEVNSFIRVIECDDITHQLTARQHDALFKKVAAKLNARIDQLLMIRNKYSGALSDAMVLSADIKAIDKAYIDFRRRNASELVDVVAEAA